MSAPLILINEYAIEPGKTEAFLEAFREIADIAHANEPDLLYFAEHLSEDGTRGSTVQVHANMESMQRHMELLGERIGAIVGYLDFEAVRIYGTPTAAFEEQMRALVGDRVTVRPQAVGFDRFGDR